MTPERSADASTESAPRLVAMAITALAALGLAAVWLLPWIPMWPTTLLEHFRVQYVVTGAAVIAAAGALRLWRYFDLAIIATLLHALPLAADLSRTPQPAPAGGTPARVLLLNVHTESAGFDRVRRLIADETPDLIGLVEVDRRWLAALAPALTGYTGRIESPRDDNFGIALYARGTLTGAAERLGAEVPTIVADATLGAARLHVILTHPVPPMTVAAYDEEHRQLDAVADRARTASLPTIVLGDFNTSPWSRLFLRVLHRSSLCDSRAGFGLQPSFPSSVTALRIPIDHLLASCSIGIASRRIGPDVGSDHLPVLIDLVVPK